MKSRKRKMKDTWVDVQKLNLLLRSGKYPRQLDMLGVGSGKFYQCAMASMLALKKMRRRTKQNATDWDWHDERIQFLLKQIDHMEESDALSHLREEEK